MRTLIKYISGFIGVMLLQTSCYEDKGNYDYHDVNTVEVTLPETKVRMPKEEAPEVVITPQISQTLEKNESNLIFQWRKAKEGVKAGSDNIADYEEISVGKECKVTVEPYQSENIGLMLVVTDKVNGTNWYKKGQITIIKPLNPCWFVLQEQEGKGVLGAIEGSPAGYYVYPDVFKSEANKSFPLEGKPLAVSARKEYGNKQASRLLSFLGFTANPALVLVTSQDAAVLAPITLSVKFQADKILFEPVNQGKPIKIDNYKMSTHGELFVNDGKAYLAYMDGFCVPYSVKSGEEYPSISAYGASGSYLFFFDPVNHSFLKMSAYSTNNFMGTPRSSSFVRRFGSAWMDRPFALRPVGQNSTVENVFNPDAVDASLEIKDIISGGGDGSYAYAVGTTAHGNELTVFKFSERDEDPLCAAKYTVLLPPGVNAATAKFATSYAYTANMLFMASGNTLYRVDLDRGRVAELYSYETDPSAQISCLKFKDSEEEEELGRCVGLGINTADKAIVVELQLTVAGDVARSENAQCVYEDTAHPFRKIVDITYNYE